MSDETFVSKNWEWSRKAGRRWELELNHSQPVMARRPHPWREAKIAQPLLQGGGPTAKALAGVELGWHSSGGDMLAGWLSVQGA